MFCDDASNPGSEVSVVHGFAPPATCCEQFADRSVTRLPLHPGIKRILRLLCLTLVHLRRPISARPGARSGHGRPKTCLLNACTCEGTRARPGFSNSNARSTYTPCAWRKQDRASSLQELNRPPGQVPSGGIYAFDVRQTLTPYLLPWLLLLEATSFWLSLSLTLSLSLLLSFSLDLSLSLWASTVCPDMHGPGTTEWACLGSQATMFKCVGCAEHSKTQDSKTHTHTRTPPHPLTHTHNTDTHTHTPHTRTHTHTQVIPRDCR